MSAKQAVWPEMSLADLKRMLRSPIPHTMQTSRLPAFVQVG